MQGVQFINTLLTFLRMGIEQVNSQHSINTAYDQYNESYPEAQNDKEIVNIKRIISNRKF